MVSFPSPYAYLMVERTSHSEFPKRMETKSRQRDFRECWLIIRLFLVTLSLSDEDFGHLVSGKKKAQQMFMSGKLKVKGDVMKATKMEPILKKAQTSPKL